MTPEDDARFHAQYLSWLQRGEFTYIFDEDWERMLRQKKETPGQHCRHGKNPQHCNTCYFEDDE